MTSHVLQAVKIICIFRSEKFDTIVIAKERIFHKTEFTMSALRMQNQPHQTAKIAARTDRLDFR